MGFHDKVETEYGQERDRIRLKRKKGRNFYEIRFYKHHGQTRNGCDHIEKHYPGVTVSRPQGTYMLFLDCEEWCRSHDMTLEELEKAGWDVGVIWQDGKMFHGEYSIRMNLALPLSRVKEAFRRLDEYVFLK